MSVLKSELKQLVTHEVGVRVEDALEAAKKEQATLEGKQSGFLDGAKAVEALLTLVDKDLTEEKVDLPTAEAIKRWLLRAFTALQNLSQQASNLKVIQMGKVQGFEHTVKLLQNMIEQEKQKAAQLVAAQEAPPPENPRERPVGVAPVSIKALRLAEDAATPPAAPVEVTPVVVAPPAPPAPVAPAPVEEATPVKKRRGRPPRASYS